VTRLGVLYPGYAAEDDFPRGGALLVPPVEVTVVHTAVGEDTNTVEDARRTGDIARLREGVRSLLEVTPGRTPDAVLWACTAGSFVFGLDGAREQARLLAEAADAPATSTSLAFVEAAHALGLRRVSVAATYPTEEAERFTAFLEEAGLTVLHLGSIGVAEGSGGARLSDDEVISLATTNDRAGADAILLPDTAVRTVALLDRLESAAGKAVLTANQVTIWAGLLLARAYRPQDGLGTLFRSGPALRSA
jgi:maleate cis-trans isomerase